MTKVKTTTIQQLIEQLQRNHNPSDSVVFNYYVAEYAGKSEEEFTPIAEYLMDNESFGEESANFFVAWINEAEDVLDSVEAQKEVE
jgi:hypothetical protein